MKNADGRKFSLPIYGQSYSASGDVDLKKRMILAKRDFILPTNGFRLLEDVSYTGDQKYVLLKGTTLEYFNKKDHKQLCGYAAKHKFVCLKDSEGNGNYDVLLAKKGKLIFPILKPVKIISQNKYYSENPSLETLHAGGIMGTQELKVLKVSKKYITLYVATGMNFHHKKVNKRKPSKDNVIDSWAKEYKQKFTNEGVYDFAGYKVNLSRTGPKKWKVSLSGSMAMIKPQYLCDDRAVKLGDSYTTFFEQGATARSGVLLRRYTFANSEFSNDVVF